MGKNKEAIYDARELGVGKMFVLGIQHMFAMFGCNGARSAPHRGSMWHQHFYSQVSEHCSST